MRYNATHNNNGETERKGRIRNAFGARTAHMLRTNVAILAALLLIVSSVPCDGIWVKASASDIDANTASENAPEESGRVSICVPLEPQSSPVGDNGQKGLDAENVDGEKHICVVNSFADCESGQPVMCITVENGTTIGSVLAKLPKTLSAKLACEECDSNVEVNWQWETYAPDVAGEYRFNAQLDSERYAFVPLDDPETDDVDESVTSPFCDLPYIIVIVDEKTVSASDCAADAVSGSDSAAAAVSGTDSAEVAVSATDKSDDTVDTAASGETDSHSDSVSHSDEDGLVCTCGQHCYSDLEDGRYIVDITCPVCSKDPTKCQHAPELVENELEVETDDGRTVTVSGELPVGAYLTVDTVSPEEVEALPEAEDQQPQVVEYGDTGLYIDISEDARNAENIDFAYDITVHYQGEEYQPRDYDSSVNVKISNVEADKDEDTNIFHVEESEDVLVDAVYNRGAVEFETDGFSLYYKNKSTAYTGNTLFYGKANNDSDYYYFYTDTSYTYRVLDSNGNAYKNLGNLVKNCAKSMTITFYKQYCVGSGLFATTHANSMTLEPASGITVTLKKATGTEMGSASVLEVNSGGTLTMRDGIIIEGSNGDSTVYPFRLVQVMGGTFNMEGGIIRNGKNNGTNGGAILVCNGGVGSYTDNAGIFNMSGGTISNCYTNIGQTGKTKYSPTASTPWGGGAIGVATTNSKKSCEVNISGGTISGCYTNNANATGGGAIVVGANCKLTISGDETKITGCYSDSSTAGGGAIYNNGTTTISGGTIEGRGSTATAKNGGAIYNKGTLTISGGTIKNCTASERGGAIYNGGTLKITGGIISENTSTKWGGGVYNASSLTISGGEIYKNAATVRGGGVCENGKQLNITGGKFTENTAVVNGGGIYVAPNASAATISNAEITGNHSDEDGGGIYTSNLSVKISDNIVKNNTADSGAGIYCHKSDEITGTATVTITGGEVSGNTSVSEGGGLRFTSKVDSVTVSGVTISGNKALGTGDGNIGGGGVYNYSPALQLSGCTITGNEATSNGGGIFNNGTATIGSTEITGNTAANGGGVYTQNSNTTLAADTSFDGNTATDELSPGVYVPAAGTIKVSGTITQPEGQEIYLSDSASKITVTDASVTNNFIVNLLPDDTASVADGRIVATYTAGSPDYTKYSVSNYYYHLKNDGQNVIFYSDTIDLGRVTASPEGVALPDGRVDSITVPLEKLVGGEKYIGSSTTTTDPAPSAGMYVLSYSTVDSKKTVYGTTTANTTFGFEAAATGAEASDMFGGATYASGENKDLIITLHNANNLTLDGDAGYITFDVTVKGKDSNDDFKQTFKLTVDRFVSVQINATVPLKLAVLTDISDKTGEFITPDNYSISNYSIIPVQVKAVEWKWLDSIDTAVDDRSKLTSSMSFSGAFVNPAALTFGSGAYLKENVGGVIEAESGKLNIKLGITLNGAKLLTVTDQSDVASLVYTLEPAVNDAE